ncbi:hypothetical protein OAU50_06535 [Planctomycetota bacterium]|nr:hypothetical protein [Planctomycetota bacterium]
MTKKKPAKTFDEVAGTEKIAQELMKETVIADLRLALRLACRQAARISDKMDACVDPKESKYLDKQLFLLLREVRLTGSRIDRIEQDCRRRAKELGEAEGASEFFDLLKGEQRPDVGKAVQPEGEAQQVQASKQHSQAPPAA